MFEKLGGRKVVGLLVLIVIGVGYSFYKGDVPENLMILLLGAYGTYAGGNVLEHFSSAVKAKRGRPSKIEPASVNVDLSSIETKMDNLTKRQMVQSEHMQQIVNVLQQAYQFEKARTNAARTD